MDTVLKELMRNKTYMDFERFLKKQRCPACSGVGALRCRLTPGDTIYECEDCGGTGWRQL